MEEFSRPNPNLLPPPSTAGVQPPPRNPFGGLLSVPRQRPGVRVTTEFDSDSSVFFHKISCKLFESLVKLKLSFRNDRKGEISDPQLDLTSKCLSLHYDLEEHNASIKGSFDVGPGLQLRAAHDVKDSSILTPVNDCVAQMINPRGG
ncbi:chloroplast outer envelope protein 37 [Actinidia rufa]|uniref:Chloroplast outer envelope protein 37 n=1 Tax=Actinidia rufa TaxID=165716 RepID=A0A7J0DZS1_9ERIC|nr:chloroplast outer envelope protein 37 [Actinidia rufa]